VRASSVRSAALLAGIASLASTLTAAHAQEQTGTAAGLRDGALPPTRVIPGDEIVMTVFDPAVFPAAGRWTIAERPAAAGPLDADGRYRITFHLPAEFPMSWDRLPVAYSDPQGTVRYDSRQDAHDAVGLADIADLTPLVERTARITGASPRASRPGRFCVCGFFPERRASEGLALAGVPLGPPLTASTTELWFEVPDHLAPGVHQIGADPSAGFSESAPATIEIVTAPETLDTAECPCAARNEFLSDWEDSQARLPVGRALERPEAEPVIWLESLGGSTGEVFRAHVVGPAGGPLEFDGLFAVEPVSLSPEERDRALESVRRSAGSHLDVQANFYCLQFGAAAPPEGVVYRIAPPADQERFQPAARALAAARALYEEGSLSPDTSPESYFHSIRQWSVWTLEKAFDREGFIEAFIEHARKNVEDAGQQWSDEFAERVERSAEGRWQDIAMVLERAGLATGEGYR